MTRKEPLLRAALELRGAAPAAWRNYIVALENYSADLAREVVRAIPDRLVHAQGRAQALDDFAPSMRDCREELEHMTTPKEAPRERRQTRTIPGGSLGA